MSMTSYYDAYNREKMPHDIWDQRRNPNHKKRSTYKRGFKSDRRKREFRDAVNVFNHHIDNPFENNDDFVPLKSDDEDEKAKPIEPEMPVLPHDELGFEELRDLASQARAGDMGANGRRMPSVDTAVPTFADGNDPDMRNTNPVPWVPRDARHASKNLKLGIELVHFLESCHLAASFWPRAANTPLLLASIKI